MNGTLVPVTHRPGRHCASTALADLAAFHGLPFTEAMCFGLGAGLGIWYLDTGAGRMVHVRSADIEAQFFRRIGRAFSWQRFDDPAAAGEALCRSLDRGLPVLVQTDIFHLPYYGSNTHFPGHDIVVWGHDRSRDAFLVTDTERPGLIDVPCEALRRAMYSTGGFFEMTGNQFAPENLAPPQDMGAAVKAAIGHNSRVILSAGYDFQGITGLGKWMGELAAVWSGLPGWRWTARFAYQVIERRGTGGGGFRLMYADFLEEAAAFCPEIAARGLSGRMREIGGAWTRLALALKDASERSKPGFGHVLDVLGIVRRLEHEYHLEAQALA